MTQSEALVQVFRSGASFAQLSALLQEPQDRVEDALRQALNSQDHPAEAQPPGEGAVTSEPRRAPKRAGASSPRPARRTPTPVEDVTFLAYPEELRDPRATTMREVYDQLRRGPVMADTGATMAALQGLRKKGLAAKRDGMHGEWYLTEKVEAPQ